MEFKKKLISFVLTGGVVLGYTLSANATNGYDMIAIGAKSLGEAGATVAHPLDASTILQNPAGMSLLDTRVDIGGAIFLPSRTLNGENSSSNVYMIPNAGFVVNTQGSEGKKPSFSYGIGMFGVSGMGVDWSNPNLAGSGWLKKAYSNLQVMEFGAAAAYRINRNLSVGISPVFVYQSLQMEYDWNVQYPPGYTPPAASPSAGVHKDVLDNTSAYGFGFNLGALYEINDYVQIGAAYESPSVMDQIDTQGLLTGAPNNTWDFNWNNQWVYAVSPEYRITKSLTVAAGFNYGQNPIDSSSLNNNIIAPAIVQSHITAGLTYDINNNLSVSGAYAYAFSQKESCTNSGQYYAMFGPKTEIEMHQNTGAIELSYKF